MKSNNGTTRPANIKSGIPQGSFLEPTLALMFLNDLHLFIEHCNSDYNADDTNGTTVKPVLNGHSRIDKTKISTTNGSLMKVKSIAECSLGAFCNTFNLHKAIILKTNIWSSF